MVDRPVVQHVVDEAKAAGIEHFVFVTGRNKARDRGSFRHRLRARTARWRSAASARSSTRSRATCPPPARRASPASRRRWASATRSGAPATSSATSPSRCSCPTCSTTAPASPACRTMIEAYDEHGGNHVAVAPVPDDQTHQYGIVGVEDRDAPGLAHHRHGGEAARGARRPRTCTSPAATSCSRRSSTFSPPRSAGAGGEIQLTDSMIALSEREPFFAVRFDGDDLRRRLQARLPHRQRRLRAGAGRPCRAAARGARRPARPLSASPAQNGLTGKKRR